VLLEDSDLIIISAKNHKIKWLENLPDAQLSTYNGNARF